MRRPATIQTRLIVVAGVVLALLAALVAVRASDTRAASDATKTVVKQVRNAKLGKTILVNRRGLTLYSLSAEVRGRFICTDSFCLSLWTPLVVPKGTTPMGAKMLATIKRPDGKTQVTYKGRPLYTFTQDTKPGDIKGNGFKDVGVWHPATPGTTSSSSGGGGGYHY